MLRYSQSPHGEGETDCLRAAVSFFVALDRGSAIDILIVFLIVLLLGGTGGWYWTGRPDYAGPDVNGVLGLLLLVVRLAGVL